MTIYLFYAAIFCVALLYACVGQAGASGYIAVMALFGFAASQVKGTALLLNVLVSLVVAQSFRRGGHFSWRMLWPFMLGALPAAFMGGWISLPKQAFNLLLGSVLLIGALPLLFRRGVGERETHPPGILPSLLVGAGVGLLSGLTGFGGGVLFTPVLLLSGWARAREAAAISAIFILGNSLAALAGNLSSMSRLPEGLVWLTMAALSGGFIGARLGSHYLPPAVIVRLLGVVLLAAAIKLLYL